MAWLAQYMESHGFEVDLRDHCGQTPLHLAARAGHASAVAILVAHGADVTAKVFNFFYFLLLFLFQYKDEINRLSFFQSTTQSSYHFFFSLFLILFNYSGQRLFIYIFCLTLYPLFPPFFFKFCRRWGEGCILNLYLYF